MKSPAARAGVLSVALWFLTAALTMAQESNATIKKVPISKASAASGEEMFNTYCAVCHGKDAKGNGPAAAALKIPPADLTTLAQRHGGKFPKDYFTAVLSKGVEDAKAHGSKEMPIWGPLFGHMSGANSSSLATLRIQNLSRYIESLQAQ